MVQSQLENLSLGPSQVKIQTQNSVSQGLLASMQGKKKKKIEKTPTLTVRHRLPISFSQMCFARRRSLCGREIRGRLSHRILGFGGPGCVCSGLLGHSLKELLDVHLLLALLI